MGLPAAKELDPLPSLSTHGLVVSQASGSEPRQGAVERAEWDTPGGLHGLNPGLLPVPALQGPGKWTALAEM